VSDPFSLSGKVAVVTGAGGLLGQQHAGALLEAGARVVLMDLDQRAVDAAVSRLCGGEHLWGFAGSVVDPGALTALREELLTRWGRLDVLVNNAAVNDRVEAPSGGAGASRFEEFPLEEWRRVIDINTTGVFLPAQILGSELARQGHGSIINVASTYGLVGPDPSLYARPDGTVPFVKTPSYPTSKGAVLAFTRFLAAYWGHRNVRVNSLVPGGVENGQEPYFLDNYARRTPLGRMASPTDYRGAVVFLASDASTYMTGHALVVDGGFTAW
jgi:NAD(P)-dependent dehydrogenase (short-subunit alcohol dehydrogenase family)